MNLVRTIKEICEKFWELEKKYNLLDLEVDGVKVWQAFRMYLYYEIARESGILAEPHPQEQASLWNKITRYSDSILFKNPFLNHKKRDVLIFDHCRKIQVDGEFIDIYTKYFIDDLKKDEVNFEVYEQSYLNQHWSKREKRRKYLDIVSLFFKKYKSFIKVKISDQLSQKINQINLDINQNFSINIDVLAVFIEGCRDFKAKHWFYKKLLLKKKPKKIYILVSYGLAALVKAAKDLNVEVIEFQHGTFSPYHLGYSFPDQSVELDYFPDKFYVWENYWKHMCTFPIKLENIDIYPFKYLERQKGKYVRIKKDKWKIVIISQGALGERIADQILENIEDLKDYFIVYKLHPSEINTWKKYKSLRMLSTYKNVQVIDNVDIPLYQILAESSFLIGVFSTVVYEGVDFDCKILLLDLPGVEYMDRFLELKKGCLLKNGNRIIDFLE